MPREITFVSTEPLGFAALVDAGVEVDGSLVPRSVLEGWIIQLVDLDDRAVLSIEQSRQIDESYDVERMTGSQFFAQPLWWTEATAPWGRAGEKGVRIARALAEATGADLWVNGEDPLDD